MAEDAGLWKQRYEFSIEAAKREQAAHRELVALLARAASRVSLACEGQDPALDAELAELRAFLKMKTLSTDVLASKVEVVEERLRALGERRRGQDPRLVEALQGLLARLAAGEPREASRSAGRLRRELDAGGDAVALLARAIALLEPPAGPAGTPAQDPGRPGLLARLFGPPRAATPAPATTPPPAPAPATPATPPPPVSAPPTGEAVSPPAPELEADARHALAAIADAARGDPQDADATLAWQATRTRIAAGGQADLPTLLDSLRSLVARALEHARGEFGAFLRELAVRLEQAAGALAAGEARDAESAASAAALDEAVAAGIEGLGADLAAGTDIDALKRGVSARVEAIGNALSAFRAREARLRAEREAGSQALSAEIESLRAKAGEAEALLAEQRRLAHTDALTGLPNRAAWNERIAGEEERWRRYGRALCLAVCDLDRFKSVNDAHGHAAGDAVLREAAARVRGALRESDYVARFGGEEFVILMPETDPAQARTALEHVRAAISARAIDCGEGVSLKVTASFGVAGFEAGDEAGRVFARADAALYEAKRGGRDRISVYSGQG